MTLGELKLKLITSGVCVERVPVLRFLGTELEDDLTWSANTKELLKKAQQILFFYENSQKNKNKISPKICSLPSTTES